MQEFAQIPSVVASLWGSHIRKVSNEPESEKACQLLAAIEEWEYSVFDSVSNTCYLGLINSVLTPLQITENTEIQDITVYTKEITFLDIDFRMMLSKNQDSFIYSIIQNVINLQHCSFICYFDMQCEIFWVRGTFDCYLGKFNHNGVLTDGVDTDTETYIFKGNSNPIKLALTGQKISYSLVEIVHFNSETELLRSIFFIMRFFWPLLYSVYHSFFF